MKVTPEKRKELCPICQHELTDIRYVGKACVIKHKDDPEYCRDSFEDFADSAGDVRWIEAPRLHSRGSSSSGSNENTNDDYFNVKFEQKLSANEIGDDLVESYFPSN